MVQKHGMVWYGMEGGRVVHHGAGAPGGPGGGGEAGRQGEVRNTHTSIYYS